MDYLVYDNHKYTVIDTIECITLADSFVKNKIGTGHGEAKLYVGNENERLLSFFNNFENCRCFFRKSDFEEYLANSKPEFLNPQQEYVKKTDMLVVYDGLKFLVEQFSENTLSFELYRVNVEPPRVYVNSKSIYYDALRSLSLPNISYISILKLLDDNQQEYFYFKLFIDENSDIGSSLMNKEESEANSIRSNSKLSDKTKDSLLSSKLGQGEFRKRLLEEYDHCPLSNVNDERLLLAVHIKPWVLSNDKEKIDSKNGLILTPTFEHLFSKGFISFEDDGTLLVSPWISPVNQKNLQIYNGKNIEGLALDDKRKAYLAFHREYVFKY